MGPDGLLLLGAAAFGTAFLTAAVGMGGGMILLAILLLVLEPLVAIPVHGVVQLVSNATRTYIQRRQTRWGIVARYAVFLLPMGYLGLEAAGALAPEDLGLAIGLFVLAATWAPPGVWSAGAGGEPSGRVFLALGAVVGFLNTTVGATGPLSGPFFGRLDLPRQGIVGTFSACQMVGHAAKIAVFAAVGFAFAPYVPLVVLLSGGVIAGTWVGSRLLDRIGERTFEGLYRTALTIVALRLVWEGARTL